MEIFLAILMDFFIGSLFCLSLAVLAFIQRDRVRVLLQGFLGIEEKGRKIHGLSSK